MGKGIAVTGRGRATGPHDECAISVGSEARAATAAEALDRCAHALDAMRSALLAAGVPAGSLATSAVSLNPVYQDYPTVAGFTAAVALTATTRDLSGVGQMLSDVVSAGGESARLNAVEYRHSDTSALAVAAREAAWADALGQATQLAGLSGRTLGEVVSIEEARPSGPGPVRRLVAVELASAGPSLDSGESDVTAELLVRWSLR